MQDQGRQKSPLHVFSLNEYIYRIDFELKMTITTKPYQQAINRHCNIDTVYTVIEKKLFLPIMHENDAWRHNFDLWSLTTKNHYAKHAYDRTFSYAYLNHL